MRVHLGSDHAGLDLKAHLSGWLTEHGYEPVDHGPFVYDAVDDYPVFCLRAAEAVAQERADGLDSLGVVIGGSGNGEQMAANKVAGIRCALAWSEETAALAPRAQRRAGRLGGRPDALARRDDPVRRGVPHDPVQRRRAARAPDRPAGVVRADPRAAAAAGVGASTPTVPEGHTLHRLATALDETFAGRPVRAGSPQGRFAESAALVDGRVLDRAEAYGKHLFMTFGDGPVQDVVHVHLGLYGRFDVHRDVAEVPEPVGQVRLRLVGARRRTPTCAAPPPASCSPRPSGTRSLARLGPDPLRRRRRPRRGLGADPAQPRPHRRAADGPVGRGRDRQRLPRRAALPAPGRPVPPGPHAAGAAVAGDVGRPRRADGRRRAHRSDRHGAARAPHRCRDSPTEARGAATPTSTGGRASRAGCAARGCAPGSLQTRNLYWCGRCQRPYRPTTRGDTP